MNRGPLDCCRQIWQGEGVRGIFRGLNITIAREIPAFGLYFASYEAMTRRSDPTKPLGTFHMLMAGGMAGVVSWLFTYPIDFLKSRLQVCAHCIRATRPLHRICFDFLLVRQVDGLAGHRVYKGIGDCIAQTYRHEGFKGFFRGMPTTLIRSFPVNAVTFSVVTWMLRCLDPSPESSSVTYDAASSASLQVQNTASFAHDHQVVGRFHHNEWLAEWKPFQPALVVLGGMGPMGTVPIARNYTIHCRCTDWISSAMSSLAHLSQVHGISSRPTPAPADSINGSTAGLLFSCRCQEAAEESGDRPSSVPSTGESSGYASAAAAAVCSACRTSSLSLSTHHCVGAAHQAA